MLTATVNALRDAQRIDMLVDIEPDEVKEREMKQTVQRVMERLVGAPATGTVPDDPDESAVHFADRCGFTKFLYQYERDGRMVIVDIMDPARTDQSNESLH
jgi:hypothetical protein